MKHTAYTGLISLALTAGLLALAFLLPPPAVLAQQPTPSDDAVNAIASQLYCPVCENVPLDVCGTQACAQWRDLIRQKLADGWTEDQIREYFLTQYGAQVVGAPPPRGLNILAYVLPPLAFLIGLFLVLRRFTRRTPVNQPVPVVSDEAIARLEAELQQRKADASAEEE